MFIFAGADDWIILLYNSYHDAAYFGYGMQLNVCYYYHDKYLTQCSLIIQIHYMTPYNFSPENIDLDEIVTDFIFSLPIMQKMLLPCGLPPEREDDWEFSLSHQLRRSRTLEFLLHKDFDFGICMSLSVNWSSICMWHWWKWMLIWGLCMIAVLFMKL